MGTGQELTREEGLKPANLVIGEPFTLPVSGLVCRVRELNAGERALMDRVRWTQQRDEKGRFTEISLDHGRNHAAWVAWCVCDAAGKRIFRDSDVDALMAWHARDAAVVADRAAKLNPAGEEEIEAEAKNLPEGQ